MNPFLFHALIMLTRLCLVSALPILLGQTAPPAEWRSFSPREGSFTVSLPSTPQEKKQQVKAGSGTLDVTLYTCTLKLKGAEDGGEVTLMVGVTEYPEGALDGAEDKRLRNARDGAVKNSQGKLFHDKKITLAGFPGRELWITTGEDGMIHSRLYAVRQRLYQTMAIGPKKLVETKEVASFLDSFRLKK